MAALRTFIICVLYLTQSVLSDQCVTNAFEEDFDTLFNDEIQTCDIATGTWSLGTYSSSSTDAPDPRSETFIYPSSTVSCISSFPFNITTDGQLEIRVYMESSMINDHITVLVQQNTPNHPIRGSSNLIPSTTDFQSGWHFMTVDWIGSGSFEGFVTFMGLASEESVVLIDSFRYIPPTLNEEDCVVYKDVTVPDSNEATTAVIDPDSNETTTAVTDPNSNETTAAVTDPDNNETTATVTDSDNNETTTAVTDAGSNETTTSENDPDSNETTTAVTDLENNETTTAATDPDNNEITTAATDLDSYETTSAVTDPDNNEITTAETDPDSNEITTAETDPDSNETTTAVTYPDGNETMTTETDHDSNETTTAVTDSDNNEITTDENDPESNDTTTAVTDLNSNETTTAVTNPDSNDITTAETDPDSNETTTAVTDPDNNETTIAVTNPDSNETTNAVTDPDSNEITTAVTDPDSNEDEAVEVEEPNNGGFWNALTISMVTIVSFIILALLCLTFYELGRRRAVKEDPTSVFIDYDKLPKPVLVPRVTKLYTDTNMLSVYDRSNPNGYQMK